VDCDCDIVFYEQILSTTTQLFQSRGLQSMLQLGAVHMVYDRVTTSCTTESQKVHDCLVPQLDG